ncbi:MAG: hypothetical protein ABH852_02530, partial [Methanobacteriota archaeon]
RIPKSFLGASLAIHLLSAKLEAATLPLAQIPSNVKTGFQYGLGLLFMIGFPEVKAKIEERLRNVPDEHRERAFINAAKSEAANQTVQASKGVRV